MPRAAPPKIGPSKSVTMKAVEAEKVGMRQWCPLGIGDRDQRYPTSAEGRSGKHDEARSGPRTGEANDADSSLADRLPLDGGVAPANLR